MAGTEEDAVSGLEIITITFSFIVGLGMAQALRSIGFVIRERDRIIGHWLPFLVTAIVLFFQVQFWFGLAVVDSMTDQWDWAVYGVMLMNAILIFVAGATVLPPPERLVEKRLIDDFETRGRVSLVFVALYLVGWMLIGLLYWQPGMENLLLVNGLTASVAFAAFAVRSPHPRAGLVIVLTFMTVWGSLTVWTTPSLQTPAGILPPEQRDDASGVDAPSGVGEHLPGDAQDRTPGHGEG